MSSRGRLAAVLVVAGVSLTACSGSSHRGSALPTVTTSPVGATSTTAAPPVGFSAGSGGAGSSPTAQVSAIQSDLAGADSSLGQADTDTSAAASAQSQNDSP